MITNRGLAALALLLALLVIFGAGIAAQLSPWSADRWIATHTQEGTRP